MKQRIEMPERDYLQLLDCAMEQSFTAVMITTACLDFPGPEILYVNAAMTRMSGYPKEALLGATPRILQGPRTDRDMLHRLRVALAAGEPFEASTVNYRRDGTPYQVEWHISPVRDETGSLTHFISVQHDITRALEDEKQIQLLSSVLEVSSDGVIMTDAVGNIEYVNASFEDYTGNDRETFIGQNLQECQADYPSARFYRNMEDALIRGEPFRETFIDQNRDGQRVHLQQTITPIKNAQEDIIRYVAVGKDITHHIQHEKALKQLANTDSLTGLVNRLCFDRRLEKELERTRRHARPLSLIMLDIDHFKRINDTYGHDVGDQVLVHFAGVLLENVRLTDLCARWGGEEFALLVPETALKQAVSLAEKLRLAIVDTAFPMVRQITVSIGVTEVCPGDLVDHPIKRADQALYRAKAKGRNQVMVG